MGQPNRLDQMPLQPQLVVEPFDRWALDFVCPIIPHSRQKAYILVCTDYMTKWVEVVALVKANDQAMIDFMYGEIFTHFEYPRKWLQMEDLNLCHINFKLYYESTIFNTI